MFAAMGFAAALAMAQDQWPGQPVAQSPRPTEAPGSALPPGFTLDPPLPPGLTLLPPQPPAWQTAPIVGSPEDPYAGFARVIPPPPPGYRVVSELSEAELLAAASRVPAGWEHVEPDGWRWRAGNDETLVLTQAARQPSHIWVRYEFKSDREGERSIRALIEVDCTGWRTRQAQGTSFSRANLQGLVASTDSVSSWSAAAPDTFSEAMLEAACGE